MEPIFFYTLHTKYDISCDVRPLNAFLRKVLILALGKRCELELLCKDLILNER